MPEKRHLPRRDIILLPALCVATLLLLIGIPELVAEQVFSEHKIEGCMKPDTVLGQRNEPNCKVRYKSGEGPWAENDYNECGYRSNESCLTKPPDTFRVALVGSSTSMGYLVPYDQTFAVRTERLLTNLCGRNVEFQSMGGLGYQWGRLEARMDEALTLKPDLVVATISPFDMRQPLDNHILTAAPPHGFVPSIVGAVRGAIQGSALWMAFLHYRANLPLTYLNFFLRDPSRSDFLQASVTPFWQQQIGYTKTMIDHLSAKAQAARVPFMVIFVPLRSQPMLMQHQAAFPNLDPLVLDRAVEAEAVRDGDRYMDFTPVLAAASNINPLYFALDDHVSGPGSVLLAEQASREIAKAHYPGLQNCSPIQAASASDD